MARASPLPDKLFFRIGEVSELVGVRPHVLRYWEEEFGILRPMKTRGAHRQYRRRDVELALVIKRLLHEEGFTVAGARRRLREMGHLDGRATAAGKGAHGQLELEMRADLLAIRSELVALAARLEAIAATPDPLAPARHAPEAEALAHAERALAARPPNPRERA